MNHNDIINYIEDEPFILDDDFYYHAFSYNKEEFINMINEGIKSPILLGKKAQGWNGYFYVSLSKKKKCKRSIQNLVKFKPAFVIDKKIRVVKAKNFKTGGFPNWMCNSPLPFRESEYDDEYQKFLKISPESILAIQYNMFLNYQMHDNIDKELLILKSIIEDLNSQKIHLPVIDSYTSKKINQEKVLSLKI